MLALFTKCLARHVSIKSTHTHFGGSHFHESLEGLLNILLGLGGQQGEVFQNTNPKL